MECLYYFPLPSFQMSHCCTEQNYLCHFWHGCYIAKFTASQKKQQQTHTQEKIVTCTFLFCFVCKLSRMEVRLLCFIPLLPGSFFTFPFVLNWLSLNQVHVPECCIESHTAWRCRREKKKVLEKWNASIVYHQHCCFYQMVYYCSVAVVQRDVK